MANTKKTPKQIKYSEPTGYFPKGVLEKHFGNSKKSTSKKK